MNVFTPLEKGNLHYKRRPITYSKTTGFCCTHIRYIGQVEALELAIDNVETQLYSSVTHFFVINEHFAELFLAQMLNLSPSQLIHAMAMLREQFQLQQVFVLTE